MSYKIAIDGTAGAGKSFVARELAKRLNILNIDSGAIYRALALYVINNDINIACEDQIDKLIYESHVELKGMNDDGDSLVYLNGIDVTPKIRTEKVSLAVAEVARISKIRRHVREIQNACMSNNNIVMTGRDIGSVIIPDADLKIYLTASIEERAKRRTLERKELGESVSISDVRNELELRDKSDMNRKDSPLIICEDAEYIDTTGMTRDQVIEKIINLMKEKGLI